MFCSAIIGQQEREASANVFFYGLEDATRV